MSVTKPSKSSGVVYNKSQSAYYQLMIRRLTAFMKQHPEAKFKGGDGAYQEFCKNALNDPNKHGERLYVDAFTHVLTLHRLNTVKKLLQNVSQELRRLSQ